MTSRVSHPSVESRELNARTLSFSLRDPAIPFSSAFPERAKYETRPDQTNNKIQCARFIFHAHIISLQGDEMNRATCKTLPVK